MDKNTTYKVSEERIIMPNYETNQKQTDELTSFSLLSKHLGSLKMITHQYCYQDNKPLKFSTKFTFTYGELKIDNILSSGHAGNGSVALIELLVSFGFNRNKIEPQVLKRDPVGKGEIIFKL
jgi:hypothetical protein